MISGNRSVFQLAPQFWPLAPQFGQRRRYCGGKGPFGATFSDHFRASGGRIGIFIAGVRGHVGRGQERGRPSFRPKLRAPVTRPVARNCNTGCRGGCNVIRGLKGLSDGGLSHGLRCRVQDGVPDRLSRQVQRPVPKWLAEAVSFRAAVSSPGVQRDARNRDSHRAGADALNGGDGSTGATGSTSRLAQSGAQ